MNILFEGVDGTGKTSLSTWAADYFPNSLRIAEPNHCLGSVKDGQFISLRDILLNPYVATVTEAGSRQIIADSVVKRIRPLSPNVAIPLLLAGQSLTAELLKESDAEYKIFDRSPISTFVYQAIANLDLTDEAEMVSAIKLIKGCVAEMSLPVYDVAFHLDVTNTEEIFKRSRRFTDNDVYDQESSEAEKAFDRRASGYSFIFSAITTSDFNISRQFPNIVRLNSSDSLNDLKNQVIEHVELASNKNND
jgi:thymidylate kinase